MVYRARRASISLGLFVALLTCMPPSATGAEQPASETQSPVSQARIAEAIRQLGDQDFRVRERATQTLWAAGQAAEPALRSAVEEGSDPEIARRARAILS